MELKKGMVIHCKTEGEAKEFIREAYKQGFSWNLKIDTINTTYYSVYRENTVYILGVYCEKDIMYGSTNYSDEDNIIEFSDLKNEVKDDKRKKGYSMTKSDLENGMVVETREGNRYLFLNKKFIGQRNELGDFNVIKDNLKHVRFIDLDIVKVYETNTRCINDIFLDKSLTLIWKREEISFSNNALEILKRVPIEFKWLTKDEGCDAPWIHEERPIKDSSGEWIGSGDTYAFSLFRKYFENVTSDDLIYINDYVDRE